MPGTGKETGKEAESYRTEVILKSSLLSGYQTDFARAVLTRQEYTLKEARKALEQFFGREGG